MNRKFSRNEKDKSSNEEKLALGELVKKYKEEYDAEVKRNERKTRSDRKRKKHVPIKPNTGYVANAIYFNLAQTHNDDSTFIQRFINLRDPSSCPPKKVRANGGGQKAKAPGPNA